MVTHLKLKNFALVGFSMGGGEVARYYREVRLEKRELPGEGRCETGGGAFALRAHPDGKKPLRTRSLRDMFLERK